MTSVGRRGRGKKGKGNRRIEAGGEGGERAINGEDTVEEMTRPPVYLAGLLRFGLWIRTAVHKVKVTLDSPPTAFDIVNSIELLPIELILKPP